MVEKPKPQDAPSDLAVMGRYLFTLRSSTYIDKVQAGQGWRDPTHRRHGGAGGRGSGMDGPHLRRGRYDIGAKRDFLRAIVEFALDHPDLGPEFGSWLGQLVRDGGVSGGPDPGRRRPQPGARRAVPALRARAVPLADALGCVTSVTCTPRRPCRSFANTAVDGFAVRAADVAPGPVTLAVIGTIAAGAPPEPARRPGPGGPDPHRCPDAARS